jgi:biopolymer transport protein ExbD
MRDAPDDEMITGINVTPLVDIVLVLLIILMVTAAFAASKAIPLDLPERGSGPSEGRVLAITLDASSQLSLDGEPITWAELERRARALARTGRGPQAVIHADRASRHGEFVRLVDTLREAGIRRYGVVADPQDE